jgi:hypothetical protein
MGANAQTTVPTFTAAQVLTADQMNQSARTGVPVFADTTARDAGFGGSGEKVLAEGQLCYLESTNVVQYYDGAAWATVGPQTLTSGLNYITGAAFTTVTSVSLPNSTFTSTYRNYRVMFQLTAASTATAITMRLRASGTDKTDALYFQASPGSDTTGASSDAAQATQTSWAVGGIDSTFPFYALTVDVFAPQVTTLDKLLLGNLFYFDGSLQVGRAVALRKYETPGVAIDSLSLIKASGTFTGIYRVYGYSDS